MGGGNSPGSPISQGMVDPLTTLLNSLFGPGQQNQQGGFGANTGFQGFPGQGQQGGFGAGRFLPSGFGGQKGSQPGGFQDQGGRPGGFPGQSMMPGAFPGQGMMPWNYQIPQAPPTVTPPIGQFAAPPLAAPAPAAPDPVEQPWRPPHDPGR